MGISLSDLSPKARQQAIAKFAVEEARRRKAAAVSSGAIEKAKRESEDTPGINTKNKYHAKKAVRVLPNGEEHVFDSQREAKRYDELVLMLQAGKIRDLRLQPQFTLQESYITANGDRVRAIRYVADFAYDFWEPHKYIDSVLTGGWNVVVEDVKSRATATPQYKMKKKMLQDKFGITVIEV